jgi:hypothetical protein
MAAISKRSKMRRTTVPVSAVRPPDLIRIPG